jgi:streptogrisin B
MTTLSQRTHAITAAAVTAGAILLSCVLGAPHAHAGAQRAISPGDAIRYITAAGADTCTLAFAFTAHTHTYGVTAGHCVANAGGYVIDVISGYRGSVVSFDYDPTRRGNDVALIHFGQAPVAATMLGTAVNAITAPAADQPICHTGVSSGTSCGQLAAQYGAGQYLTTGLTDVPGDSGGPVWTRHGIDDIAIVGIWLGSHIDHDGTTYGRFYPLDHALTQLGANTAAR